MFERQHLTWGAGEDVAFWVTKKTKGGKGQCRNGAPKLGWHRYSGHRETQNTKAK